MCRRCWCRVSIVSFVHDLNDRDHHRLGLLLLDDALIAYQPASLHLQTSDLQLLAHFVANSNSLRSHDQNWVPICMPSFNSTAFLQAYVASIRFKDSSDNSVDIFLVLIATTSDPTMFKELHNSRLVLESSLGRLSLAQEIPRTVFAQQQAGEAQHEMSWQQVEHCFDFSFEVSFRVHELTFPV